MKIFIIGILSAINWVLTGYVYRLNGARFNIRKFDPLSYIYLIQLIMCCVGSFLIATGIKDTDWLNYMPQDDPIRVFGWMIVQYSFLGVPLGMLLFKKFINKKIDEKQFLCDIKSQVTAYSDHIDKIMPLLVVCVMAGVYVHYIIGYIPILKGFESSGYEFALIRSGTKLDFQGLAFVRDYLYCGATQILCYYCYSLVYSTKNRYLSVSVWVLSFILAFFSTTINLEKSGFVFFCISLLTLHMYQVRGLRLTYIIIASGLMSLLLYGSYIFALGTDQHWMELISEILDRLFLSQVAGVFMALSIFPDQSNFIYLNGIRVFALLFGNDQSQGSARIMMEVSRPEDVRAGWVGYMSAYFPAESYANFGVFGIISAPLIVGFVTSLIIHIFMNFKNKNLGVAGIIYASFNLPFTSNFVPFIYNPGFTIIIVFLIILDRSKKKYSKTKL